VAKSVDAAGLKPVATQLAGSNPAPGTNNRWKARGATLITPMMEQHHVMSFTNTDYHSPVRILLDSNIWRYIVDADALPDVIRASQKSPHVIAVAPALV
jgi:hypothetical protein